MDFSLLLLPVGIVVVVGLMVGLVLTIASIVMAVPVNEKEQELIEILPGANCGACGYSGCQGYANALAEGNTANCSLCSPGGKSVAAQIATCLGLNPPTGGHQLTAVVQCRGTCDKTQNRVRYQGVHTCQMASALLGGPGSCQEGCLGYGDCVRACPYDAIRLEDGVAMVDPRLCRACKICVAVCPKHIIAMIPLDKKNAVNLCNNHEKGALAKKQCAAACIGCSLCAKKCPKDCIKVERFNATVDPELCVGCHQCVKACPTGSMQMMPAFAVENLGEVKIKQKVS